MAYENEKMQLNELHEAAKAELAKSGEKLVVWAGGDAPNQQDALIQGFEKRFPGVPLHLTVDLSKFHDIKVYQQLMDGYLEPDIVMLQTMNDFEDWKAMGVLEPFKPESFPNLKKGYSDEDGAFLGVFMFCFLPQYAKEGVSQPPRDYEDFLKPEYKDRLVLTPPHDDDAVLFVYDHILQKRGVDFLKKLATQRPAFVRGTAAPALLAGRQGYLGNLTGYPTYPSEPSIGFVPRGDVFVSWPQRAAIFKLTRHKAAAKLWLAWLTSYEHQASRGSWSVREDVAAPEGLGSIESHPNTDPLAFIRWMRNREHIHKLRMQMEAIFGPVRGVSPLVDPDSLRLYYSA